MYLHSQPGERMKRSASIPALSLLLLLAASCHWHVAAPDEQINLTRLEIKSPEYVPLLIEPSDNLTTVEGAALGRKLYYDPDLSTGGPLEGKACASCHLQAFGFTLPGPKSPPVLPHVNLGWNQAFLWNGAKQGTLEDAMRFEVEDFFQVDLNRINANESYRKAFKEVFGADEIDYPVLAKALAQFLRTVNSFNSEIDAFLQGKGFLNESVLRGYEIFNSERADCFHCHSIGLFTDAQFHNNGLDSVFSGFGEGLYAVTGNKNDLGKFKTPTLRNVALRGPYMHDGRFSTLEEVVEFYNSGVLPSSTLDPIMTKPGKESGLHLSEQDKADLVNFMKALTDTSFIHDTTLSNP